MQIRVLTEKSYVAKRYEKAVRFFLDRLLTAKEREPVDITIGFYPEDTLSKSRTVIYGDTISWHGEEHKDQFHIRLNKIRHPKIRTLAHELVHVKQIVRGEYLPSKTNKTINWKGKRYNINNVSYFSRKDFPWELEAVELEKTLFQEWKDSQ